MKENSIEEDIKILDEMILNCRYKHNYYDEYAEKKAKVLEKCKKALKENEEYYKQLDLDYVENNFISKQRIEDIIDRIDYDIKKTKEIISSNRNTDIDNMKNDYQIVRLRAMNTKSLDIKKRLQELLESEE